MTVVPPLDVIPNVPSSVLSQRRDPRVRGKAMGRGVTEIWGLNELPAEQPLRVWVAHRRTEAVEAAAVAQSFDELPRQPHRRQRQEGRRADACDAESLESRDV